MFQVKLVEAGGKYATTVHQGAAGEVHRAAGEEVGERPPGRRIVSTATPILATHDLGLDIGGARIVADVSLEVREGELVGIIGPNGAGKTTLFNLLSGLVRADRGAGRARRRDVTGAAAAPADAGGARPLVPGLERLPAAVRRGERAACGRGEARRARSASCAAPRAFAPALDRARRRARAGRARGRERAGRPGCSRTATSGSSRSRCSSPATRG